MKYLSLRTSQFLFIISFLFIVISTFAQQNHGKVKGQITTSDGQPAGDVNIILKNSKYGTFTNDDGSFEINRVKANTYTLQISFPGYETSEQEVIVEENKTATVNLQLKVSNKELQEVVISGRKSLLSKKTETVARMPLKNLENPQVYNVIHKELFQEQVAIDITTAMRNAPGVVPLNYPSGGFALIFRGFTVGINARNGMETLSSRSSVGIANVERIEILKGPSGTLFGSTASSFGGVVNLVTKKPFETTATEVGYTAGSYGTHQLTADVNTPLTKDKRVLFRLNVGVNKAKSFLDYGFSNTLSVTPSLTFKATDRLTFNLDAELYNVKNTRPLYPAVSPTSGVTNPADVKLDYKKSLVHDDADAKSSSSKFFTEAEYKISDNWRSTTLFSYVSENIDYSYQVSPTWTSPTTVALRATVFGPISSNYTNIQENINGEFKTGILTHKLVAGFNYRYYSDTFSSVKTPDAPAAPIRTIDVTTNFNPIRKKEIDALLGNPLIRAGRDEHTISSYASYVMGIDDRFHLMASLRLDDFDRKQSGTVAAYKQTSVSPKIGVVYQIVKDQVSVFGNYMNGFQNLAPVIQPSTSEQLVLDPIYAEQFESGIKADLFNKKLSATVSYYDITVDNAVLRFANGTFIDYSQGGKQQSKGVEFELLANPIPGLDIIAGYAYNDNSYIKGTTVSGTTIKSIDGKKAADAPENVANFWVSYKLQNKLKGLGAGLGGNYVDESFMSSDNIYYIPSYMIYGATVFYEQPTWRAGVKIDNLTNERYWSTWGAPQAPTTILGSLTFKF